MTTNNLKIFINTLFIAFLSIAISNIVYDIDVFNKVVETEEIEETDYSFESPIYQSKLLSDGYGGDTVLSPFLSLKLKEPFYFFTTVPAKNKLSKRNENFDSVPLFIRYCSLKIYS